MQEIRRLRADEFERVKLAEGNWRVSYHDATHLPEDKFIELGGIHFLDVEGPEFSQGEERVFVPFAFEMVSQEFLSENFEEVWKGNQHSSKASNEKKKYSKRVYDELSQTFLRCLMKSPKIVREDLDRLEHGTTSRILISDTNAVKNGLLNWLCHSFSQAHNWIAFLIISQIQFQEATERGKKKSDDPKPNRYSVVLRRRSLANLGTYMEKRLKEKLPVEFIDLPPELLRYYGGRRDGEERVTTILEDRLLIEGIKLFFKERNISDNVQRAVVTSDLYLTKFLDLESIRYLYGEVENLADGESVYSTKYNLFRKDFDFCKIHTLLWDLTYVFSTIKVEHSDTGEYFVLRYYPVDASRSPKDWKEEALFVEHFEGKKPLIKKIRKYQDARKIGAKRISLDVLLDVVEFIASKRQFGIDELARALSKSEEHLKKRAFYVLTGIGLLKREGEAFLKTDLFERFLKMWDDRDLLSLHEIFLNFKPYEGLMQLLSERGSLPAFITEQVQKETVEEITKQIGNRTGYSSLKNWGIALGAIYAVEDRIYYGVDTPSMEEFAQGIETEFLARKAIGKQVAVSEMVDSVCKKLRITPIRFEDYINESFKRGVLRDLEPHAAAGIGKKGVHKVLQKRDAVQRFRTIAIDASITIAGIPTKALVLRKNTS